MPNKYYLREDRKAVKPTRAEPKGPTDMLSIEKMAFIEHLKSLPALDVDPDYLKTLSPGWFEGEEQYEVAGLKDKWRKCTKEEYEKRSPVLWYRVSIVAPQEAEKLNDDPVRDDFWIMNEPGQRPATPQPVTGEARGKSKSKRITLCGSTKFKAEFEAINRQLTLEGNVVYSVCAFGHKDNIKWTDQQKEMLDEVHKRKIDNSDGIFVINVDDYIGESTRSEIEYAEHTGKFVKYLSDFPDLKYISDSAMIAAASRPSDAVEDYDMNKLYEWVMDENRKPAITAFTSSKARYVADQVQFLLSQDNRWIRGSEVLDRGLHDIVLTIIDGKPFAYDSKHNWKGLLNVLQNRPDCLCLLINKPRNKQNV